MPICQNKFDKVLSRCLSFQDRVSNNKKMSKTQAATKTQDQLTNELKDAFNLFDQDGDGKVSIEG